MLRIVLLLLGLTSLGVLYGCEHPSERERFALKQVIAFDVRVVDSPTYQHQHYTISCGEAHLFHFEKDPDTQHPEYVVVAFDHACDLCFISSKVHEFPSVFQDAVE